MKKLNFFKIALFIAISTTGAFAQFSAFAPANIGLPTGIDYVFDVPGNPTFNRLGHLQSGVYGDPSSQWAAIGVPNLNFPPANNNYYGFFANWQSDRAFFGLRKDGVFNNSNAMIAFGDNHDNDPVPNRLIFQFDSWVPSFSKEIGTMLANGNVGFGTSTPTANLEVNSVTNGVQTAIIGKGINTGVFGEATDMNASLTAEGIVNGWSEAIGVFGKGTYATTTSNGNIYGVAGSATGANPLNNIGVYGEAKNASGYNSGVIGNVYTTNGLYNTGVGGLVTLNSSAGWNRAIAGYAPVAPNHFAGYFEGKVAIVDGSQANNFVLTSDANGLATWKDVCSLPCFTSAATDWHTNGNATAAGDFIGTTNANPFNVYTNNLQRMTLDSSGKMGLGTATPTGAALHLLTGSNPGMLPPAIKLDRNDGTNQAGLLTVGISSNGFGTLLGGGSAYFKLEDPYGNSANSDMGFSTNSLAAQMVIKHSGNVGIGTSSPLQKLHVQDGGILISGNTPGYGGPQLIFTDNHLTTPNGRWAIEYLSAAPSRPSMGGLNFWKPFPDAGGAGNYSLFLKDDGKIGMGVTDDSTDSKFCASALPNGYRLYVNGGILTTKVKVANYCSSSWADYVFASDYKLKPLSEVEAFIKENKHLPNVPSAIEIEKDGLDLADMQSKQMEKIEELTLYLIEMRKEIDLLKKENANLKIAPKN